MPAIYVGLQIVALGLMALNVWVAALLIAGVALLMAFRGPVKRCWGSVTPLRAPRPRSTNY